MDSICSDDWRIFRHEEMLDWQSTVQSRHLGSSFSSTCFKTHRISGLIKLFLSLAVFIPGYRWRRFVRKKRIQSSTNLSDFETPSFCAVVLQRNSTVWQITTAETHRVLAFATVCFIIFWIIRLKASTPSDCCCIWEIGRCEQLPIVRESAAMGEEVATGGR